MSSDRRFEYETGPELETERDAAERDERTREDEQSEADDGRPVAVVAPWKGGTVAGVSAFGVMFAAFYQLISAFSATGGYSQGDTGPSDWVAASLASLANHGVTILQDGEPMEGFATLTLGLTPYVTGIVPAVILAVAGYLLVRYVRLESRRDAGLALGSLVASYVVLTGSLSLIARWTPEQGSGATQETTTISAAADFGAIVAIGGTALVFAAIGAGVAALPQLLTARR